MGVIYINGDYKSSSNIYHVQKNKLQDERIEKLEQILEGSDGTVDSIVLNIVNTHTEQLSELNTDISEIENTLSDKVDKVLGKQLSSEDFTKNHKAKLETLKNYNDSEIRNLIKDLQDELTEAIEQIEEDKVDKDDNAPKLTAGFANNLVGRGEATDEEISFRPSGGDTSIEDGTARIERLKGSTVVWNQLAEHDNTAVARGSLAKNEKELVATSNETATSFELRFYMSMIEGHTYLIEASIKTDKKRYVSDQGYRYFSIESSDNNITAKNFHADIINEGKYNLINHIGKASSSKDNSFIALTIRNDGVESTIANIKDVIIVDLTKMFGKGNEPTTIEEFNARKPIGIDEYAYNEGELISTNVDEVKSVGFNVLDVSTMQPNRMLPNGNLYTDTSVVHSDYIKVLPSRKYFTNVYCKQNVYTLVWFDENKAAISCDLGSLGSNTGMPVTSPSNAAYVVINLLSANYDSANFVFHLTHTGYRNCEYEPYKEFRRSIPISEIKDSDGNQLFPNGLLSAGSVYDEITATKAIKRIGVVDLGTYNWNRPPNPTSTSLFKCIGPDDRKVDKIFNAVLSLYNIGGWQGGTPSQRVLVDKTIYPYFNVGNYSTTLYAFNLSYTDPVLFAQSMSGVMLYYELAEPIEVDLPEPLNLDYEVSDFGTEEVISDVPTTPMKADIIYQFNAVDRIRDNSRHTAEAEELLEAKADKTTVEEIQKKELQLSVKDNGNIVLSNANGDSKEFMPATPSGDPMHYAYIEAGAEWNDTDATITKTLETVSYDNSHFETFSFEHKPKCWYLNGVGDITNEEMRAIYNYPHYAKYSGAYAGVKQKTVIFDGNGPSAALNLNHWFAGSAVKSLIYRTSINASNVYCMFYNTYNLEYLLPAKKEAWLYGYEGFKAIDFSNDTNTKWKEIRVYLLKKSCDFSCLPNISKNSVLYAINTCRPTTAITITLHADAYARLGEDADVLAALEAKNEELQGTGGSISLVSA